MLSTTIWGRNYHYPHFSDEESGARETESNKWLNVLINCSDFLAYTYTVLIFSAGFTKKIASVSSFLPSVPLLSSVKQMSLRTGVRTKPDIWKCYFPNYKKKKKPLYLEGPYRRAGCQDNGLYQILSSFWFVHFQERCLWIDLWYLWENKHWWEVSLSQSQ